ncbi:unnamed protein product [Bemisia tabaci]|uniref:Mevalonate kinase n=1 Tax=Bemisia tabaci TaxID=7038 RepID=A0A9P0A3U6_BEMTA|nr:PREDICTED: mevalonate kinase [Bemisia tabaci]CAH0383673.1 unnamed protein product [Bemisia tabaci]
MADSNNKINFCTSSPGKIILFGEHSVVYGKLAVAASISNRTTATFKEVEGDVFTLNLPKLGYCETFELANLQSKLDENIPLKKKISKQQTDLGTVGLVDIDALLELSGKDVNFNASVEQSDAIRKALHAFFFLFRGILGTTLVNVPPSTLEIDSELELGAGTGSSASFCVTLAAAFIQLLKQRTPPGYRVSKHEYRNFTFDGSLESFSEKEKIIISCWALHGEKINHGKPSGLDNSVCTHGAILQMNVRGFLKHEGGFQCMDLNIKLSVLLINSGVSRDTKSLVSKVRSLKARHEGVINLILNSMEGIAEKGVLTLQKLSDLEKAKASDKDIRSLYTVLEELFDLNHGLLSTLQVSHEKLEHIRAITAGFGLHTKLTGAGGGGYAIALIPPDYPVNVLPECINQLEANNYQTRQIYLGGEGVNVKQLS